MPKLERKWKVKWGEDNHKKTRTTLNVRSTAQQSQNERFKEQSLTPDFHVL